MQIDGDDTVIIAGLQDLKVLKSTQSGFVGYPKDKYTTLPETEDRILATSVTAKWRYNRNDIDFNEVYADVRRLLLAGFSRNYSYALQHTLKEMAEAVLEAHPEIDEIRFSTPNSHHFVVDLTPFGLENPNEVFYAADRPYGSSRRRSCARAPTPTTGRGTASPASAERTPLPIRECGGVRFAGPPRIRRLRRFRGRSQP